MYPTDLPSLGGPFVDAVPPADPQAEVSADQFNRLLEDVAQLTRPPVKARVWFVTSAVAAPFDYLPAAVSHCSQWGNGSAQKPVVRKTADGLYTITYALAPTDPLGVVETVNFTNAQVSAFTTHAASPGDVVQGRRLTCAANVCTIRIDSPLGTLANVGNISALAIGVCVELS